MAIDRADYHAALVASTIVNMTPRKSKKVVAVEDFMPGRPKKKQTWHAQLALIKDLTAAFGGEDKTGG